MSACDYEDVCEFHKDLATRIGLAAFFLSRYCHGPFFNDCARHVIYSRGGDVPVDLYPNQTSRIASLSDMAKERTGAG